tara:strand:- start:120 stop:404 length:285 start_codon:yes stop_codon:yes gene_type:complete
MTTWYFPKEVWKIIKRYEHDLLYPTKYIKKLVKEFKYHIHSPYWLGLHQYKSFEHQYRFLKESKLTKYLWNIYTNEMICFKINNEIKKCNKIYY